MGKLWGCAWGLGLVLLLSEAGVTMPEPTILVQQWETASSDETRAAAQRAFDEGMQLYQQGTAESLRQAIDKWEVALPLWRELGDREQEALALRRELEDRAGVAVSLNNIGSAYLGLEDKETALDYYQQALPLMPVSDRATTLNNIGAVYLGLGEKQKALEYFQQALPLYREVGDPFGEANTLYNITRAECYFCNLQTALAQIQAAIDIIEDLRTKIASQELRASYFAENQRYYEFYINLLMQLHYQNPDSGYDSQALHISERARARGLLELLTEANADIRQGVEPALLERERTLQQQLNAADTRRTQLLKEEYRTHLRSSRA